jgi:hypothetical protein
MVAGVLDPCLHEDSVSAGVAGDDGRGKALRADAVLNETESCKEGSSIASPLEAPTLAICVDAALDETESREPGHSPAKGVEASRDPVKELLPPEDGDADAPRRAVLSSSDSESSLVRVAVCSEDDLEELCAMSPAQRTPQRSSLP